MHVKALTYSADVVEGVMQNGEPVAGQSKQDLERLILSNGGKRWQTVPKDQECIIISGRTDCTPTVASDDLF